MSERLEVRTNRVSRASARSLKSKDVERQPARSTSVLIVGPLGFYSEGLRRVLEGNQFRNVDQTLKLQKSKFLQEGEPQLIIITDVAVDAELPSIVSDLRSHNTAARIAVLVDANSSDMLGDAMRIPAHAFLNERIGPQALIKALDVILGDGGVLSINFAAYLTSQQKPYEAKPSKTFSEQRLFLSSRETDILRCLTDGISNKLIARQFDIAESTVKIHVKSILRKINVQNRTQAAIWALANCPRPEEFMPPAGMSGQMAATC